MGDLGQSSGTIALQHDEDVLNHPRRATFVARVRHRVDSAAVFHSVCFSPAGSGVQKFMC